MSHSRPLVLLVQLPIPPPGPQAIQGNIPLAAGYLKLFARKQGLEESYRIEILPPRLANDLGDQGLAEELLAREPWMVGFTCYLWNIDRTLWLAQRLKQARPGLFIVLGGPEITADNGWVLEDAAVDYAVIGEGEQTFADLLRLHADQAIGGERAGVGRTAGEGVPGLWSRKNPSIPPFRRPLGSLDEVSSPYLADILDAADERTMFLETVRGCVFKCKFCYYPKSYDAIYFVSRERIAANLEHARQRGVREVVLLDPTLNQRRDFAEFLRLLAEHNPDRRFTYFGELRAEGIHAETARLLKEANFSEVEIGLQSLDPRAQTLMDRKVNLKAFERGAKAMLDAGIDVRVDLILGLPGDTVDSFRRNVEYLQHSELFTAVQVFNLSILPGTAFRQEAQSLGLAYQPRPPYYVLRTPAFSLEDLYGLMEEAQAAFDIEFDPLPAPVLEFPENVSQPIRAATIDLDAEASAATSLPPANRRAQAFSLWLRCSDFDARRWAAAAILRQAVEENPHTTLQVVLEPLGAWERLTVRALEKLLESCFPTSSYLDRFYSLHPNRLLGAKRLVVLMPEKLRGQAPAPWIEAIEEYAMPVWRDAPLAPLPRPYGL
ncbi:MAG: B12-binding domain-containing radical SAM protein [Thermoguttaceae bacterium]